MAVAFLYGDLGGEKGLMSIGMETVRARRLHSRTVSPIQLRPTRSISCRTSNGMSPSSTPIIQIPPSNPVRPSLPESRNSEKFSWAEDVEGYYDPVN